MRNNSNLKLPGVLILIKWQSELVRVIKYVSVISITCVVYKMWSILISSHGYV